ncbi:chaperone protein ClpC, chloroplastic [Trifolium repens]|nr:chaperone protein ClpC, chloroplastic [Trifolium repens]
MYLDVASLMGRDKRQRRARGDIILFIDEVHTLVQSGTIGRGSKGFGFDIANLLKPSLGRGQFQVIVCLVISFASFLCSNKQLLVTYKITVRYMATNYRYYTVFTNIIQSN